MIIDKIDIMSLNLEELEKEILDMGEKKFRALQIFGWLHVKKVKSFDEMSNLSIQFRKMLNENFCIKGLFVEKRLDSLLDNTVKYLYRLDDGNFVEAVLMEYHHGTSLCVSTQVGCKMGCRFCASGIAGFVRNLTPSEILAQVYESERQSGKAVSSIVLMGIGEPLDNYSNVIKFLELISSGSGNNLSMRHVTLSTCGIVPKIYELAERRLGLTLSVSLHSPYNDKRSEIMPVNNTYNINELIKACDYYVKKTGRRVTFEYAVIDGVNSSECDAAKISEILRGINCHVNLIPVNKVKERNFRSADVKDFQRMLEEYGINATVRRTLGSDIQAACGQLRTMNSDKGGVRFEV